MEPSDDSSIDRRSVLKTLAAGGTLATLPAGVLAQLGDLGATKTCGTEFVQTHRPEGLAWGRSQPDACEIQTGLPGHEPCVRVDSEGTVYYSAVDEPTGIARSSDGGETWEALELPEDYDTAGLDLGGGVAVRPVVSPAIRPVVSPAMGPGPSPAMGLPARLPVGRAT